MRKSSLLIVYVTVFIDLLGFGIILPSLPFYAVKFGATGLLVGVLLASYSAAQFIGAAVLGRLSDRIGRRPVLLLSLLGSAISLTVSGLAGSLAVLIIGRSLAGLFGGSIAAAQAFVADVTKPEERAKYLGMLGASIGMGFVFGPALGGALSDYGFSTAAFVAAGLAAVNFVAALFLLPESRDPSHIRSASARFSATNLRTALSGPGVAALLTTGFLITFAMVGMEAVSALAGQLRFDLGARELGIGFSMIGITMAIVQGVLVGRLVSRYGEKSVAVGGSLLMGVSLALMPFAPSVWAVVVVVLVFSAGNGLVSPSLSSLLSRASSMDQQGGVLGINQSTSALARMIGPLAAGWLFDASYALPFVIGGFLTLLAAVIIVARVIGTKHVQPVWSKTLAANTSAVTAAAASGEVR